MKSTRVDKVRKAIMREVGEFFQYGIKDPRITGLISVTDVDLSNDCQNAKIYLSIFGISDEEKEIVEAAIEENISQIRKHIARQIPLRYTPEVSLFFDNALERGDRITSLINKISRGEL